MTVPVQCPVNRSLASMYAYSEQNIGERLNAAGNTNCKQVMAEKFMLIHTYMNEYLCMCIRRQETRQLCELLNMLGCVCVFVILCEFKY